jgi:hypothetical protein
MLAVVAAGPVWAARPKDPKTSLDHKAFFRPELALSSAHAPLEEILAALPNQAAWRSFLTQRSLAQPRGGSLRVFMDPRSGAATNIMGAFPLIPGSGVGNRLALGDLSIIEGGVVAAVNAGVVAQAARGFVETHKTLLGIDTQQLGEVHATQVAPELWQIHIPQVYSGIPVRDGRVAGSIKHGNLVVIGAENWGDVRVNPNPRIGAEEALEKGFAHADGRVSADAILREPALEIVPVAPPEFQDGEAFRGPVGKGYGHRLVWTFVFNRPPEDARWEVMVDAHSGEVIAFQDINHCVNQQIQGGVYPLTNTEICPDADRCGVMQLGWPMPYADTGFPTPNNFTNSAGIYDYTSGTAATTLTGRYVDIVDHCGAITASSTTGAIDLDGVDGQHDCTVPAGSSPGNTASSRSCFYEINKIAEVARGWLPANTWLQARLTANVNINNTCNAFWNGTSINFYRSGGGCRNTGEIAGVFDHEWGHGLDDNDANGSISRSGEAYADIAAIYRLETSCVGYGFFQTRDAGCGQTSDGTGFNSNESQTGTHCDLDCSGVRDSDWDKHADHLPDTALGFVCTHCSPSTGPCGRQVHCAAAPVRQMAWDLVTRDLTAAPFSLDSQTAFIVGNKLFYQGSGNVSDWHSCGCGSSASGCGSNNGYMQWLTADDDNGNLNDGTPHMTAIHDAYNRHGIACAAPTPTNSGCGDGAPPAAPTLSATDGDHQVALSWTSVAAGDGGFAPASFVLDNFGVNQAWAPSKHVRTLADISNDGKADIVAFGDAGVWTALSTGDGGFAPASFVLADFGVSQAWDPSKHMRTMADINNNGQADIVAFGDAGVWTALSTGDGGFAPASLALANFGVSQAWDPSKHVRMIIDEDIVAFGDAGVWTALSTRYWVFRTEGHAGCNFGKALIAEVTGLSYTDTQVANGRTYHYNVVAAGSSSACFGRASTCVSATPRRR